MQIASLVVAAILLATTSGAAFADEGVGGSDFHKNDITYSTEVETPHVDWAPALPGGPIKGFFIPSIRGGRDMVELMQRLSLAPTTVTIDRSWDANCWGIGDYYSHEWRGDRDDFRIVYNYVEKDLTGPAKFEVMLIPGLNGWSRMTKPTRDAILKRVEDGAGLVLLYPYVGDVKGHPFATGPVAMNGWKAVANDDEVPIDAWETEVDERVWDISPLVGAPDETFAFRGGRRGGENRPAPREPWTISAAHFITEGLPMSLLPEGISGGRIFKYRANGDVLIRAGNDPVLAVRNYGKGRVVALAYSTGGFIPDDIDPIEARIAWNYWEYEYSLLARSVMWAAGRDSGVAIASLTATPDGLTLESTATKEQKVTVDVTGRNEFGQELGNFHTEVTLARGLNTIKAPGEGLKSKMGWPGGKEIFDVMIRDAESKATLNWGTTFFETPKRATIELLVLSTDCYRDGDALSAQVKAKGDLKGLKTRVQVSDDLERLLNVSEEPAKEDATFTAQLADFLGRYAFVTAQIVDEKGAIVDQARVKPALVVQSERRKKEFQALLSFGGGRSFLMSTQTRLVREGGVMSGFTWGGGVSNGLSIPRGSFGIYWYDRGPTTKEGMEAAIEKFEKDKDYRSLQYLTRKELYKRTGDKKLLARVPCLDDPEFLGKLSESVKDTAAKKAAYNLDYYFVGDEGSLTSYGDPFDFCWDERTLAAFRKWLEKEYGGLDALNAEWKTAFKTWEEVVPFTTDEALKSRNFAPWADHRTYMEIQFTNAYKTVRDAAVAGDPDGHIAVSGTQATNAYNGCDWYRLDQVIDDFLSYNGGNQWDLDRSFAKPGSMIGYWTGYGSSGIAVQNAIWTAAIHNVLYPNIFWFSSYLNPDLTYSKSARDMGDAFKALKFEGVGKLFMESERQQDGIAVHFSMASVHAASVINDHQPQGHEKDARSIAEDRNGWVETINDLGMQFDFVSYDQLEKRGLSPEHYKVFILPYSQAISPSEAKRIRAFVDGGGVVIADAMAGVMDGHCAWREEGVLNDLFGIKTAASSKRVAAPQVESTSSTAEVKVTDEGAKWGLVAQDLSGIQAIEPDLKAADGTALLTIGKADAAVVKKTGKGCAIYLNALFDTYDGLRRKDYGGADYRALVSALLTHAGVEPVVKVLAPDGKPVAAVQVVRYRLGDSLIVAMVKENMEGVVGKDGVTYYADTNLGQVARQDITVKLPGKFHVANVRTGESLGLTDTVRTSITVGGALVFGLEPATNKIKVAGPSKAEKGEHVQFAIKTGKAGPALVRCHLFGPDGKFRAEYAKNVLVNNGKGTVVLPSALNDPTGEYKVTVTDVVSGATAEATVKLK